MLCERSSDLNMCACAQHARPAACWINSAGALRVVYALPILLTLIANAFFFTRTVSCYLVDLIDLMIKFQSNPVK